MSGEKVIRDGQVAVLVSPGYGAGWSTWADDAAAAVFAPDVVEWVEAGKPEPYPDHWDDKYGYAGGLGQVEVVWLPEGTRFTIDEYDGSEALIVLGPDYGYVA